MVAGVGGEEVAAGGEGGGAAGDAVGPVGAFVKFGSEGLVVQDWVTERLRRGERGSK